MITRKSQSTGDILLSPALPGRLVFQKLFSGVGIVTMDYTLISVIIALAVLGFALIINKYLFDVFEEDKPFLHLIAAFLVVFVIAAIAISYLNPTNDALAKISNSEPVTLDSLLFYKNQILF